MNLSNTIFQLQLISSLICSIIIGITLLTSIKIMSSYRQKHVFILLISGFIFALLPQLAHIAYSLQQLHMPHALSINSTIAGLISFIIINFVYMKMYAAGVKIRIMPSIFLIFGVLIAIGATIFIGPYSLNHIDTYPILDFYMFIIIITMLIVTRHIEMPGAYFLGLVIIFSSQLSSMLNSYVFEYSQQWLTGLVLLLPIFYYVLLYYILLEWIMERLLSTYQSSILDGLTGLYIRRHFQKKMLGMMQRKPVAVIFCDIDNFKSLNDSKGHQVADQALQQVASIIKEEVAPFGIAGRYGGEELLGGIAIDKVKPMSVAERIRARIEEETIVTVSVGFSTTKEAVELMLLVKQADEAMYYSKTTGKNKVTGFRSMPAAIKQKAQA